VVGIARRVKTASAFSFLPSTPRVEVPEFSRGVPRRIPQRLFDWFQRITHFALNYVKIKLIGGRGDQTRNRTLEISIRLPMSQKKLSLQFELILDSRI